MTQNGLAHCQEASENAANAIIKITKNARNKTEPYSPSPSEGA